MAKSEQILKIREEKRKALSSPVEEKFMRQALKQARKALECGEVPIGCVIVRGDRVIARGYNRRNTEKSVLAHAEISAIKKACKKLGDFRLEDCIMYVTLEPCPMCAGAIVQARIPRVIFGAYNPKAGSAGTVIDMFGVDGFNHRVKIDSGIMEMECADILKEFFAGMRASK